jgi:hypothetical protein
VHVCCFNMLYTLGECTQQAFGQGLVGLLLPGVPCASPASGRAAAANASGWRITTTPCRGVSCIELRLSSAQGEAAPCDPLCGLPYTASCLLIEAMDCTRVSTGASLHGCSYTTTCPRASTCNKPLDMQQWRSGYTTRCIWLMHALKVAQQRVLCHQVTTARCTQSPSTASPVAHSAPQITSLLASCSGMQGAAAHFSA